MFYEGVLLNTCFIKDIILPCWKVWTSKNQQIIQYLFKFCKHLISSSHPHRKFNLRQIQSSELLESILLQIKVIRYNFNTNFIEYILLKSYFNCV